MLILPKIYASVFEKEAFKHSFELYTNFGVLICLSMLVNTQLTNTDDGIMYNKKVVAHYMKRG